ncbi:hypothetical protein [Sedimentitalea arenosa]|jgi:hypothetical protein|nr:hypothetical protein [Arenibacterium arenosum]
MIWTDLTQDWAYWYRALQERFPNLEESAMPFAKIDRSRFEAYLAQRHNLSLTEAHEEVEDFLYVQGLMRDSEEGPAAA